jgi:hypothetical protein
MSAQPPAAGAVRGGGERLPKNIVENKKAVIQSRLFGVWSFAFVFLCHRICIGW